MKCKCTTVKDAAYYEEAPKAFFRTLEEIAIGNWIKLFRCKVCGQHLSIDEWDKYVERVITKIYDVQNWERMIQQN